MTYAAGLHYFKESQTDLLNPAVSLSTEWPIPSLFLPTIRFLDALVYEHPLLT
jgi:hypothetical protein